MLYQIELLAFYLKETLKNAVVIFAVKSFPILQC